MFHLLSFQKHWNRVYLNSVFVIVFSYSISFFSSVNATTISNFGQWTTLNSFSKTAYTAGVIDTFFKPLTFSDDHKNFIIKFESCFKNLNITIVEVARMVDNFYQNSENWKFSPQEAIRFQLINGHCYQYLN